MVARASPDSQVARLNPAKSKPVAAKPKGATRTPGRVTTKQSALVAERSKRASEGHALKNERLAIQRNEVVLELVQGVAVPVKPEIPVTVEHIEEFIRECASGLSMYAYCKREGTPRYGTMHLLFGQSAELSARYEQALHARADMFAHEVTELADHIPTGWVGSAKQKRLISMDSLIAIQRARLRIEARQWIAAQLSPHRYGTRMNVDVNTTIRMAPDQVDARLQGLLAQLGKGHEARLEQRTIDMGSAVHQAPGDQAVENSGDDEPDFAVVLDPPSPPAEGGTR